MVEMKPIVRYIRLGSPVEKKYAPGERRPEPIGVVVALSPGKLGWSLCNPNDRWGRQIAYGRAAVGRLSAEIPPKVLPYLRWAKQPAQARLTRLEQAEFPAR